MEERRCWIKEYTGSGFEYWAEHTRVRVCPGHQGLIGVSLGSAAYAPGVRFKCPGSLATPQNLFSCRHKIYWFPFKIPDTIEKLHLESLNIPSKFTGPLFARR